MERGQFSTLGLILPDGDGVVLERGLWAAWDSPALTEPDRGGSLLWAEGSASTRSAAPSVSFQPAGTNAADTVPGSTFSFVRLSEGGTELVSIDSLGDRDWYRIDLTAGVTYTIQTAYDGSLTDANLKLRTGTGQIAASDDDSGDGLNALFTYTPSTSGTYFIDAGTFDNASTGTFFVSVARLTSSATDTVAGSTATSVTLGPGLITPNLSVSGRIDTAGDHDFYRVNLSAGQVYYFRTAGTQPSDTTDTVLTLRDASGNVVLEDDDARDGTTGFSAIRFIPSASGTYYLDVSGFENATGAFNLSVYQTTLPVFSNDQIATQLTSTYWDGATRRFDVAPGGTLSFNVSGLTADGQALARAAIALWSDVTGILFNEVASGGQLVYDDNEADAFTSTVQSAGIISSAAINISTAWLVENGTGLNSYSFQTYVHETGHALGLGHAGDYNAVADYMWDASYLNDGWAATIMSYFDQAENSYFQTLGFTKQYIVTPMVADIIAVQNLYGASTATRPGDTTYGFNNNSGREIFTASAGQAPASYTIVDNGGVDTLDYSGFSASQHISLVAESFSNVGGRVGSVSIARGTVIENAFGGSGADTLTGNAAANLLEGRDGDDTINGNDGDDTIAGGAGSDTISGGEGNDIVTGGQGNDLLFGDTGTNDEARYLGNRADYVVDYVAIGGRTVVRVTGQGAFAGDGADLLRGFEFAQFGDQRLNIALPDNRHPVLGAAIPSAQSTFDGELFSYQVPEDAFTDPDPGTVLSYGASLAGGSPLPAWLTFDPATRTFSGIAPLEAAFNPLDIVITASDNVPGDPLSRVSTGFTLFIAAAPGPDITGTPGSDTLVGTGRWEQMFGLAGDDVLFASEQGDLMDGGDGNDTADYSASGSRVTVQLGDGGYGIGGLAFSDQLRSIENLVGSAYDDELLGDEGPNFLSGLGGNDTFRGDLGNDTIDGGGGNNDVAQFSGNRADYLIESVTIDGVAWTRITGLGAFASDGIDLVRNVEFARFTDQTLRLINNPPQLGPVAILDQTAIDGQPFSYQVPVGAFVDPDFETTLSYAARLSNGSALPGWLLFNSSTRTFSGTPPVSAAGTVLEVRVTATDSEAGYAGTPVSDVFALQINAAPGPDIVGTAGSESLSGTFRPERIFGLDGSDRLLGSNGADIMNGGAGTDWVEYGGSTGVTVNLATGFGSGGQAEGDQYVSIENIVGTSFGDILIGDNGDNVIESGGGADTAQGGGGNDRFVGFSSFLSIDGGLGFDTMEFSGGGLNRAGQIAGIEAIAIGAGTMLVLTGAQIAAGLTLTTAITGTGALTVNMTAGQLLAAKLWSVAPGITLEINGTTGTDIMKLANAVQTVNGGDGTDQIKGGSAVDTIDGGAGIDKIMGLGGADVLTGGAGNDVFRYLAQSDSGLGAAADRITDFTIGQDRLNFVQIDADAALAGDQAFAFIGTGAFTAAGTGQIRYQDSGADLLVLVDVNGDGAADMSVVLQGLAGQVLGAGQFVL